MSTDTEVAEQEGAPEPDAAREAIAGAFAEHLGADLIESHIAPGRDLWIRINPAAWTKTARFAKERLGMTWLDFISAIDWLPSPFGRDMDAEQDWVVHGLPDKADSEADAQTAGLAGGDTRFQMVMRLYSIADLTGVTIKADLPEDTLAIDTLIPVFAGANWHEREVHEMFGIAIKGHPDLRALYLPSEFEGNPMRKDFPLVSRRVKPWPGIVDVEAMPETEAPESGGDAQADPGDQPGEGA